MKPKVTMRQALADPDLLGNAIAGESWALWRTLLIAAMGEALLPDERAAFTEVTGRQHEPGAPVEEMWTIAGRRSGKTRAAGVLACYLACLCDHSAALAAGERGVLPILAASTTQATRAFNHVVGVLESSPVLSAEIAGRTSESIALRTGIDIEIRVASFKTIRGITAVGVIADEVAFWSIEGSANPDREILDALRPSLATTGGPLVCISTPYGRRGELYNAFKRHYGPNGDKLILVTKGSSRHFNPTLKQSVIDKAYERDAQVASAEWGGEFRSDVEAYVSQEVIEACTISGRHELPFASDIRYVGFVDPSGGSQDSMTMAIAHKSGDKVILDCVRERRPPFSPEAVVGDFCGTLNAYHVHKVQGDRYAGEWCREPFRKSNVNYEPSAQSKSDLYQAALPLLNSNRIELLDNKRLASQLLGLERRTARGGRDSIDHAPGAYDDVANAACGAIIAAQATRNVEIPDGLFEQLRVVGRSKR